MCFSVAVNITREHLKKTYNLPFNEGDGKLGFFLSAFNKPYLPIVTNKYLEIKMARWGLVPSFVNTIEDAEEISMQTFNAKAETLAEKPSFKNALMTAHCIIPVNGFFEWQHQTHDKTPYFIKLREPEAIMSLAGLYSLWNNPVKNELLLSFTIITVPANPLMEVIHNTHKRMPAIIEEKNVHHWLNPSNEKDIQECLQPFNEDALEAYTVSPRLIHKNADIHNPHIVKHYEIPKQGKLF